MLGVLVALSVEVVGTGVVVVWVGGRGGAEVVVGAPVGVVVVVEASVEGEPLPPSAGAVVRASWRSFAAGLVRASRSSSYRWRRGSFSLTRALDWDDKRHNNSSEPKFLCHPPVLPV